MEKEQKASRKSRARGRPRKKSADETQEDRRERARKAQKNYQLRKQADNDSFKERVAFLEGMIETLSNEFIGLSDRIATSRAPNQVLHDFKRTGQRFLEIARAAEPHEASSRPPSEDVASDETLDTAERSSRSGSMTPKQLDHTTFPMVASSFRDMPVMPTAKWSPRLGYGLMVALPGWEPTPETLWPRYSVAGANSFATRIYSDAVRFLLMLIRGQVVMPGALPHMGRYRFRHEDPRLLAMHLEEHLTNLPAIEQVEIPPSDAVVLHGPVDVAMNTSLRRLIFQDVRQELGSIEDWVDPFHAQKYLLDRWQIQLTSNLAQVPTSLSTLWDFSIPILEPPQQDFYLVVNAQPLAQSLVSESICFGEGPRFFKGNIDKAVIAFLSAISM